MEKVYHLKFPDGSFYKGDFDPISKNMFNNFGCLMKNNELYLSYSRKLLEFYNSKINNIIIYF